MDTNSTEAILTYGDGQFILRGSKGPGNADHVVCAVTGRRIHLHQLRYWSVDRQEAYVDGAVAFKAEQKARES